MKPVIGITPLFDYEKESLWMLPGYYRGVIEAGGVPVILPLDSSDEVLHNIFDLCDGFLFTGGQDVSPLMYNEWPIDQCGEVSSEREAQELKLLEMALRKNIPVLGICRGIQLLNVCLGGSLYQDIPSQTGSSIIHKQEKPYCDSSHDVSILSHTPLHDLLCVNELKVNSVHHCAIKNLSEKLSTMATAPDGIIEAVYMPEKRFVWAVQWHPEYSYEKEWSSREIFSAFVMAASRAS